MTHPQNNSIRSAALALCVNPEVLEKHLDEMRKETEVLKSKKVHETVPYKTYQELFEKYSYLVDEVSSQKVRIARLEKRLMQYEPIQSP